MKKVIIILQVLLCCMLHTAQAQSAQPITFHENFANICYDYNPTSGKFGIKLEFIPDTLGGGIKHLPLHYMDPFKIWAYFKTPSSPTIYGPFLYSYKIQYDLDCSVSPCIETRSAVYFEGSVPSLSANEECLEVWFTSNVPYHHSDPMGIYAPPPGLLPADLASGPVYPAPPFTSPIPVTERHTACECPIEEHECNASFKIKSRGQNLMSPPQEIISIELIHYNPKSTYSVHILGGASYPGIPNHILLDIPGAYNICVKEQMEDSNCCVSCTEIIARGYFFSDVPCDILPFVEDAPSKRMKGNDIISSKYTSTAIYPNPVDNLLTIQSSKSNEIFEALIYDITGKVVYKNKSVVPNNNNKATISTETLAPGQYLIKITNSEGSETIKFTKE